MTTTSQRSGTFRRTWWSCMENIESLFLKISDYEGSKKLRSNRHRRRKQRRTDIVWIIRGTNCGGTGGVNIVSFPTASSPRTDIFAGLVGEEIPSLVLIGTDSDPIADNDFQRIFKSLSAVLLGKKSVKEWPRIFTEQWLSRIPALAEHRSVTALKAAFKGQDILIASPGPSLYDSLVDLKARRDRFLLIAPIRSLRRCSIQILFLISPSMLMRRIFRRLFPTSYDESRSALICTDYAHASVFEGGFKSIYTVPDPAMVGNAISEAISWAGCSRASGWLCSNLRSRVRCTI